MACQTWPTTENGGLGDLRHASGASGIIAAWQAAGAGFTQNAYVNTTVPSSWSLALDDFHVV